VSGTAAEASLDKSIARRLAERLPDFQQLSPELYVPFEVSRIRDAELVWVNARWFGTIGIDLANPATAAAVERFLIDNYGVGVIDLALPLGTFTGPRLTFHADRYGATGGSTQGGSGRVGACGPLNVKGIGRTPLVSPVADWQHSHGSMWLEEAIREALFTEIVDAEFPHGAVPVVAIIATGIIQPLEDGDTGERALVVRPNFLRAASLQRTIFFGSAGIQGSDQVRDSERVRHMWERLWQPQFRTLWERGACETLEEAFLRLGEQYGFGHAVRLWPGPVFSSNVSLDGRLVDFGSMRAMSGWGRAQSKFANHSFGGERTLVANLARSLATIGGKHGVNVDSVSLDGAFETGLGRGFDRALADHSVKPGSADWTALRELFAAQQRRPTTLWEDQADAWPFGPDHPHASLLSPRPSLFREALQTRIRSFAAAKPARVEGRPGDVARLIEHEIRLAARAPGLVRSH
jgi:hypothetical protein